MNEQWMFVIAAYAMTALLTAAVLGGSWQAMRRAERRANAVRQDRT